MGCLFVLEPVALQVYSFCLKDTLSWLLVHRDPPPGRCGPSPTRFPTGDNEVCRQNPRAALPQPGALGRDYNLGTSVFLSAKWESKAFTSCQGNYKDLVEEDQFLRTCYLRAFGCLRSKRSRIEQAESNPAHSLEGEMDAQGWKWLSKQYQGLLLLLSLSSWPQPCASRRAWCLGNWVDPDGTEPSWAWRAPGDPGKRAVARKLKRPRKTLLHQSVFHTENQFSRVFPRSGLASLVVVCIFPWPPAASRPNPLLPHRLSHLGLPSPRRREGSWAGG